MVLQVEADQSWQLIRTSEICFQLLWLALQHHVQIQAHVPFPCNDLEIVPVHSRVSVAMPMAAMLCIGNMSVPNGCVYKINVTLQVNAALGINVLHLIKHIFICLFLFQIYFVNAYYAINCTPMLLGARPIVIPQRTPFWTLAGVQVTKLTAKTRTSPGHNINRSNSANQEMEFPTCRCVLMAIPLNGSTCTTRVKVSYLCLCYKFHQTRLNKVST